MKKKKSDRGYLPLTSAVPDECNSDTRSHLHKFILGP